MITKSKKHGNKICKKSSLAILATKDPITPATRLETIIQGKSGRSFDKVGILLYEDIPLTIQILHKDVVVATAIVLGIES